MLWDFFQQSIELLLNLCTAIYEKKYTSFLTYKCSGGSVYVHGINYLATKLQSYHAGNLIFRALGNFKTTVNIIGGARPRVLEKAKSPKILFRILVNRGVDSSGKRREGGGRKPWWHKQKHFAPEAQEYFGPYASKEIFSYWIQCTFRINMAKYCILFFFWYFSPFFLEFSTSQGGRVDCPFASPLIYASVG